MAKARVNSWLSREKMRRWMREAKTRGEHERRLAVWLAELEYPTHQTSEILAVSVPTIRRWVQSYNRLGPEGLSVGDWGGRRRELLTPEQEKTLLERWPEGEPFSAKALQTVLSNALGRRVSLKYAYDLIRRHGFA